MATRNLVSKVTALALAGSLANGCIQEECLDTYFLGTPQVSIEEDMNGRVHDISLKLLTDQRPYVNPIHRGIPAGDNLSIYCAPTGTYGREAESDCKAGKQFEFFISFIDRNGNVSLELPENWNGSRTGNIEDIWLEGQPKLKVRCNVWSPECVVDGYADEEGHFVERGLRPRTLVGSAEAEIITEQLCPAPLPSFRPVDEEDWRPEGQ